MNSNTIEVLNLEINRCGYLLLIGEITNALSQKTQKTFTGANVNTVNVAYTCNKYRDLIAKVDILHPDGIGVFLASKFMYGKNGFKTRITGSDFYQELIRSSITNHWSLFFLGDTDQTLNLNQNVHSQLIIKGYQNGFNFNNTELINRINEVKPDILIVGLGSPKQEEWMIYNKKKINTHVIIAVGDGIKVFSGTKKRGAKVLRILGFEWLVRLINEPSRLWKRYLIGIPVFIYRVINVKIKSYWYQQKVSK